ncbi:hypothetical protein [Chryseobacterium sp. P1-3]|uniref:hypothetical protein n=1 Tax=Chryseobacterium sp. (strain P1-3) TaxID=1517683 RepID=UPI001EE68065|nr:hypothetical protein [Chryseobacterium sp. P1-3]
MLSAPLPLVWPIQTDTEVMVVIMEIRIIITDIITHLPDITETVDIGAMTAIIIETISIIIMITAFLITTTITITPEGRCM